MKTEKNILIAFVLNIVFSIFELFGGAATGSIALISDAVHDFADGISIGISWLLEKKSSKRPDEKFTYGYGRYSVVGSAMISLLLLLSSLFVVYNALCRMIEPKEINYNAMIPLAVIGVCVNFAAAYVTHGGSGSLNQKAVNLHMLEDVFGWLVVLLGAIVMRVTDFALLDPILSVGIAVFIFIHAWKNMKEALDIFFEKVPAGMNLDAIKGEILGIGGVSEVCSIHLWSMDGQHNIGVLSVVTDGEQEEIKDNIRKLLDEYGIGYSTIETAIKR